MLNKLHARLLIAAVVTVALTSCGDSKSSGTGEWATLFATATAPASPLDADLVSSWTTAAGAASTTCAVGSTATITPDSVNYIITATPYSSPNTGQTNPTVTSNLVISRITLTLTPANTNTPALPPIFQTQYLSSGQLILPGTTTVPVQVASRSLKEYIAQGIGLTTACTNVELSYRATVSFDALEVNTNRASTITAPGFLLINFADFQ
jgi:hypothetical protein